jgi:hypothetical protein
MDAEPKSAMRPARVTAGSGVAGNRRKLASGLAERAILRASDALCAMATANWIEIKAGGRPMPLIPRGKR